MRRCFQRRSRREPGRGQPAPANTANLQGLAQDENLWLNRSSVGFTQTGNSQTIAKDRAAVGQDEAALKSTETSNSQTLAGRGGGEPRRTSLENTQTGNSQYTAGARRR